MPPYMYLGNLWTRLRLLILLFVFSSIKNCLDRRRTHDSRLLLITCVGFNKMQEIFLIILSLYNSPDVSPLTDCNIWAYMAFRADLSFAN